MKKTRNDTETVDQENPSAAERSAKSVAGSQTVDRTLGLLKLVAAAPSEGIRLMDLADQSGLDRSTVYRLISTLAKHNFVDQDTMNKRYTLGLEFFALASAASNRHDLSEKAHRALEKLAESTGDTATFCLRSGSDLICIDVETGNFPIRTLPMDIGSRRPIGAGATGIALLAALPDHEIEEILKSSEKRLAKTPGQDPEHIREQVADCRRNGYMLAPDEPQGRIMGLAMVLSARNGRPLGTLALNGIPERFDTDRIAGLAALLREQVGQLGNDLTHLPENERSRSRWMSIHQRRPRNG